MGSARNYLGVSSAITWNKRGERWLRPGNSLACGLEISGTVSIAWIPLGSTKPILVNAILQGNTVSELYYVDKEVNFITAVQVTEHSSSIISEMYSRPRVIPRKSEPDVDHSGSCGPTQKYMKTSRYPGFRRSSTHNDP